MDIILCMMISSFAGLLYDRTDARPLLISIDEEYARNDPLDISPSPLSERIIATVATLPFLDDHRLKGILCRQMAMNFEKVNLITFMAGMPSFQRHQTCLDYFVKAARPATEPTKLFRYCLVQLYLRKYLNSEDLCWKLSALYVLFQMASSVVEDVSLFEPLLLDLDQLLHSSEVRHCILSLWLNSCIEPGSRVSPTRYTLPRRCHDGGGGASSSPERHFSDVPSPEIVDYVPATHSNSSIPPDFRLCT